jgi:hypothetical protein
MELTKITEANGLLQTQHWQTITIIIRANNTFTSKILNSKASLTEMTQQNEK